MGSTKQVYVGALWVLVVEIKQLNINMYIQYYTIQLKRYIFY